MGWRPASKAQSAKRFVAIDAHVSYALRCTGRRVAPGLPCWAHRGCSVRRTRTSCRELKKGCRTVARRQKPIVSFATVSTIEPVSLPGPNAEAIRKELERVLSSGAFLRNERQSQFLRFLVERHLQGRHAELKESVI